MIERKVRDSSGGGQGKRGQKRYRDQISEINRQLEAHARPRIIHPEEKIEEKLMIKPLKLLIKIALTYTNP